MIDISELLPNTQLDDEQREWACSIRRFGNGFLTLVHDVLDLTKVETGKLNIEQVPGSLMVRCCPKQPRRRTLNSEGKFNQTSNRTTLSRAMPGVCDRYLQIVLRTALNPPRNEGTGQAFLQGRGNRARHWRASAKVAVRTLQSSRIKHSTEVWLIWTKFNYL